MHNGYVAEIEHLDQPDLKQFIKDKNDLTFVCLDEVTDPRNIGSLIRSAASFKIDGLIKIFQNNLRNGKCLIILWILKLFNKGCQ